MLQRAESPSILAGVEASRSFFAPCFALAPREERLWVAHVDGQSRCAHLATYGEEEASSALPVGAILADAAYYNSAGVVLAHNHVDGDPAPSPAERAATAALQTAADAIDLTLLDRLVFAAGECTSFRRLGLL